MLVIARRHSFSWALSRSRLAWMLGGLLALSEREREVGQLMLASCTTKEVARHLAISVEAVRAHNKHFYAKLGINSHSELFALFWQDGR